MNSFNRNPFNRVLTMAAVLTRRVHRVRGVGRLYLSLNRQCLRLGAQPLRIAPMADGTRLFVDLRSGTEAHSFYQASYEPETIHLLLSLLDPGATCLDVGANIGFVSVAVAAHLKRSGSSGKVVSFEPVPSNVARLKANVGLNGLEDVCSIQPLGLSDSRQDATITLREDFCGGSATGNASLVMADDPGARFATTTIHLARLDDIWPELASQVPPIGVVKLDIEGHEDYFLAGASQTLADARPFLLMEVNKPYYKARGVELDEVILGRMPADYVLMRHIDGTWSPLSSLHECDEIENIVAVPSEKLEQFRQAMRP